MLRPLADNRADTAGCGVHQNGVARFYAKGAAYEVLRRHAFEHHRRRLLVTHASRNFHQFVGGHQARFRVGANRRRCTGNAVANFQIGDVCAERFNDACAFEAEPRWQRDRVQPGAMIGIDEVQTNRGRLEPHFVGTGRANHDFLPFHHFRPAMCVQSNCVRHCKFLFSLSIASSAESLAW